MSLLSVLLIVLLTVYLSLIPVYLMILVEKERMITMLLDIKNPRRRRMISEVKKDTRKDFILTILWPLMLVREARNVIKNKK